MKKLPENVQSLLCATSQINSFKRVVEELVYNALDAEATSIAVRVHIQDNRIQVIDNGCGVTKADFSLLGQNSMTSKFVDLDILKSAPNLYGFRGQSLFNIIQVSKCVKVTSRYEKSDETWMKLFENGKEKEISKCHTRPSKGTTVEVKGFLYNLSIQNKSRDILNDLQSIKTLLELLSLVHCNISLSLRDDSKNELIFTMHKKRDIIQTLLILYDVKKEDVQELKVEKNNYKVIAFIGKNNVQAGRNLLFLNGKFISGSSKLHNIVNKGLKKNIKLDTKHPQKISNGEENSLFNHKVPFYCIFITCPYMDYDLSYTRNNVVLEFKDWEQVNRLLEKLIKFYAGDIKLNRVTYYQNKEAIKNDRDTRDQVKKIMDKILGSHSKKPGISQVQKGIKGKLIKRKNMKEPTSQMKDDMGNGGDIHRISRKPNMRNNGNRSNGSQRSQYHTKGHSKLKRKNIVKKNTKITSKEQITNLSQRINAVKSKYQKLKKKSNNNEFVHGVQTKSKIQRNRAKKAEKRNILVSKFALETDSVKKRCDELHKRTNEILKLRNIKRQKVFVNETVQYRKVFKNNKNISIRKKVDEIVIHDYIPIQTKSKSSVDNCGNQRALKSTYDLVQTILKSQQDSHPHKRNIEPVNYSDNNKIRLPICTYSPIDKKPENTIAAVVTFESHNRFSHENLNVENNNRNIEHIEENDYRNFNKKPRTFISKQSRDNFSLPKNNGLKKKNLKAGHSKQIKNNITRLFNKTAKLFSMKNQILKNIKDSSYSIAFSESNTNSASNNVVKQIPRSSNTYIQETWAQSVQHDYSTECKDYISVNTNTYTITNITNDCLSSANNQTRINYGTYTIAQNYEEFPKSKTISDEIQKHKEHEQIIDPINVCETLFRSEEMLDKEFDLSFNNRENILSNVAVNFIDQNELINSNLRKRCNDSLFGHGHTNTNLNENNECNSANNQSHTNSVIDLQKIFNDSLFEKLSTTVHEQSKLLSANNYEKKLPKDNFAEISHHFSVTNENVEINNGTDKLVNESPIIAATLTIQKLSNAEKEQNIKKNSVENNNKRNEELGVFDIQNRPCFLPKGMSPIFANCISKARSIYDIIEYYYENDMYTNFVDDIQNRAEVFQPRIEEANNFTSKAIDKVNDKLDEQNASLKFDAQSIKDAKILGQIDEKFVAAIMKGGSTMKEILEFLVLFDQHAVHERIRLETNLADYLKENQWKSIALDEITLKVSKDDVLYLHNYKEKFTQFGLEWTVLNNDEVSISAIPEAILGKNPRQVEKIIKAVKNLISEEINILKLQSGCISLYPKSIMDLVFSEACRYAIKFGDKLSKCECVDLLRMLSVCKTPFQCAHGRPVMAVIMQFKRDEVDYKVNFSKVKEFKRRSNNKQ